MAKMVAATAVVVVGCRCSSAEIATRRVVVAVAYGGYDVEGGDGVCGVAWWLKVVADGEDDVEMGIEVSTTLTFKKLNRKGLVEEGTSVRSTPKKKGSDLEHFDIFPLYEKVQGRVKGLKVFVWNFTYECDFMVLEDTTSVIDHYLGSVVFGKPFMEATMLVYNKEEEMVMFERDKERIIFKMPHKMDMFKHVDFADRGTDSIPPFFIESDNDKM
ncbi:hypothetical protein Tco_1032609 [Tanacetum coccineum]|uniref:Uncharacterized protein n=1 Tax=Tanacetum coccineum TaxID=301880 RepID=A0ABQ5GDD9_9ASTR